MITNEDYECGNVPAHSQCVNRDRTFPAYKLDKYDFEFWDIVLVPGYYEAACIDYRPKEDVLSNKIGYPWQHTYMTQKELFKMFALELGVSLYRVRKVCNSLIFRPNSESYISDCYDVLEEYLKEQEETKINECLDELKDGWGYDEYVTAWSFSNGETGYRKI